MKNCRSLLLLTILVFPLELSCGGGDDDSGSSEIGQIAFTSNRQIYLMDSNGNNRRNISNNSSEDVSPSWSPNGTLIAFASGRDGNGQIYVMDADGSNQRNISNSSSYDEAPAWKP